MSTETERDRGRVLVVDDKISNRELLRQELEAEGFEVTTAANGLECLQRIQTFGAHVVILDIQMPGMDGIEVCRRIKADPATADVPVLFLTGREGNDAACVAALEAGGNDFLVKPYTLPTLLARVTSQLAIYRAQTRLRATATHDELTGIFSRRFFLETARIEVRRATRRPGSRIAVIMVDLDHFKGINDRVGPKAGDAVLRSVAERVRTALRASDVVARIGGEELSALLVDADSRAAAIAAERVRRAVEEAPHAGASVTVSIGIAAREDLSREAVHRDGGVEEVVRALLRNADDALYRAKMAGRNRLAM